MNAVDKVDIVQVAFAVSLVVAGIAATLPGQSIPRAALVQPSKSLSKLQLTSMTGP